MFAALKIGLSIILKLSKEEEFHPGRYIIEAQIWDLEVINKYVAKAT